MDSGVNFHNNNSELPVDFHDVQISGVSLVPTAELDQRPDKDIVSIINTFSPVVSEKNVWTFWDFGFLKMRPWTRRNILGWVRLLGPDWTVRVLDLVPGSPNNVFQYLEQGEVPECLARGTMTPPNVGQHSSDLVRLPLLRRYGGVWMDVSIILFRHLDDICWKVLEDPQSPYCMAGFKFQFRPNVAILTNAFIAAKKGVPFMGAWHDLCLEIWKGRNSCNGIHSHPLLRHLELLNPPQTMEQSDLVTREWSDYMVHFLAFERLRMLKDPGSGFDGVTDFEKKTFLLDANYEMYLAQTLTDWNGQVQYDLLSRSRQSSTGEHKDIEARTLVSSVLGQSSLMKLSHAIHFIVPPLAELWDREENTDADIKPGSYAELLRWGSLYLRQKRKIEPLVLEPALGAQILHAGVLEAAGLP